MIERNSIFELALSNNDDDMVFGLNIITNNPNIFNGSDICLYFFMLCSANGNISLFLNTLNINTHGLSSHNNGWNSESTDTSSHIMHREGYFTLNNIDESRGLLYVHFPTVIKFFNTLLNDK